MAAKLLWRGFLTTAVALCVLPSVAAPDILLNLFQRPKGVAYSAVQSFNRPRSGMGGRKIKISVDPKGILTTVVLAPVSRQGSITVDDGRMTTEYNADSKVRWRYPSQRTFEMDPGLRTRIARKNYRIEVLRGADIAARSTVLITATPVNGKLPSRSYWLDRATNVVLRSEREDPDGESPRTLDTYSIQYGTAISPVKVPEEAQRWRQEPMDLPVVKSSADAIRKVSKINFGMPDKLPLGYQAYLYIHQEVEGKYLVSVAMTDGLGVAVMNVMRAKDSDAILKFLPADSSGFSANSLVYRLVSDLPQSADQDLLRAFLNAAKGS